MLKTYLGVVAASMGSTPDGDDSPGHQAGNRVFNDPFGTVGRHFASFQVEEEKFPIRLSFAMTINKAQGKTIPTFGIYLLEHVFSHGQLYVALSRGVSRKSTRILEVKAQRTSCIEMSWRDNTAFGLVSLIREALCHGLYSV